jgi:hypothetical protein
MMGEMTHFVGAAPGMPARLIRSANCCLPEEVTPMAGLFVDETSRGTNDGWSNPSQVNATWTVQTVQSRSTAAVYN